MRVQEETHFTIRRGQAEATIAVAGLSDMSLKKWENKTDSTQNAYPAQQFFVPAMLVVLVGMQ